MLFDSNDNPLLRVFNSAVVGTVLHRADNCPSGLAIYGLTRFPFAVPLPRMALVIAAMFLAGATVVASGSMLRSSLAVISVLALLAAARFGEWGVELSEATTS